MMIYKMRSGFLKQKQIINRDLDDVFCENSEKEFEWGLASICELAATGGHGSTIFKRENWTYGQNRAVGQKINNKI